MEVYRSQILHLKDGVTPMTLLENIYEALRSIRGNLLRTVLTALIVSIGLFALVGILTGH